MKLIRSGKTKILIALLAVFVSGGYFYSWHDVVMREIVYPLQYDYMVQRYSYENNIDPALVAAVILAESRFNKSAASHRGAVGLMQIMPETGEWIAGQLHISDYSPEQLENVSTNIKMGTWYLAHLIKQYKGNKILALAAYNAGHGNVDDWVKKNGWGKDFSEIEKIPFSETREYVKVVMQNESQYKKLYNI